MSRLDCLIAELCPNGVEIVPLCDVARICNGRDHKALPDGNIPVYGSGGIMRKVDTYMYDKPSVLIPRKGSLNNIYFVDTPFWTVDTIFYTAINEEKIMPKYFYYFIVAQRLEDLNQAGGVPSLTKTVLDKVKVSLPPLPVQSEIVRILDNFTELTAGLTVKLTEELTARKKQYEYYRNHLLTFGDDVPRVPLGEIAKINNGKDHKGMHDGKYPCYGSGGIMRYVDNYLCDRVSVLIPRKGSIGNVFYVDTPFWTVDTIFYTKIDESKVYPKFFYYFLLNQHLEDLNIAGGVPSLTKTVLDKVRIPLPSLKEQTKIVAILDKFDVLTTDISSSLSTEIRSREKQYEYYRDKLLASEEVVE